MRNVNITLPTYSDDAERIVSLYHKSVECQGLTTVYLGLVAVRTGQVGHADGKNVGITAFADKYGVAKSTITKGVTIVREHLAQLLSDDCDAESVTAVAQAFAADKTVTALYGNLSAKREARPEGNAKSDSSDSDSDDGPSDPETVAKSMLTTYLTYCDKYGMDPVELAEDVLGWTIQA